MTKRLMQQVATSNEEQRITRATKKEAHVPSVRCPFQENQCRLCNEEAATISLPDNEKNNEKSCKFGLAGFCALCLLFSAELSCRKTGLLSLLFLPAVYEEHRSTSLYRNTCFSASFARLFSNALIRLYSLGA